MVNKGLCEKIRKTKVEEFVVDWKFKEAIDELKKFKNIAIKLFSDEKDVETISQSIDSVGKVIKKLENIDNLDLIGDTISAWRFIESMLSLACGNTPYFGNGDPTSIIGINLLYNLMEIALKYRPKSS
ncbi:MAG: hypothetical protein QXU93_11705 [Thermoproteus sp.]